MARDWSQGPLGEVMPDQVSGAPLLHNTRLPVEASTGNDDALLEAGGASQEASTETRDSAPAAGGEAMQTLRTSPAAPQLQAEPCRCSATKMCRASWPGDHHATRGIRGAARASASKIHVASRRVFFYNGLNHLKPSDTPTPSRDLARRFSSVLFFHTVQMTWRSFASRPQRNFFEYLCW